MNDLLKVMKNILVVLFTIFKKTHIALKIKQVFT